MPTTTDRGSHRRRSSVDNGELLSQVKDGVSLGGAPGDGLDLRARLRVIRRRFFYFATCFVAVVICGAIYTIRAPRIYRATATVYIDVNTPEVLPGMRDVGASYWSTREYYQTQYGVIRSRMVADKVVATLGLAPSVLIDEVRAMAGANLEEKVSADAFTKLPERLRTKLRMLGLAKASSREEIIKYLEHIDPAAYLRKRLDVNPVKDSRLVRISVEFNDPELSAIITNAVVDAYIDVNLDEKMDATRSAIDWLTNQMQDLREKLTQSEAALHQFRKENNIDSVSMEDKQTINAQTMAQLNQSLSSARAQGFALASRRDEIRRAIKANVLPDTLSEVVSNAYVQKLKAEYADRRQEEAALRQRYTAAHPQVEAAHEKVELIKGELTSEINKIMQMLDKEWNFSVETQRRLENEIQRVKDDALELGQKELDYARLKRERDNNLSLFDVMLKREKEANLTQMLKANNVRRLDTALVPQKPVRPNTALNMLGSLFLGVLLGVAVAFMADHLDNSVKSQDQIEHIIGLPFLGLVPTIKTNGSPKNITLEERDLHVVRHPRSVVAESWRTIRTNIMFMSPDNPARSIIVSSSGPKEGKSTTVINLSVTMALLGARTLMVDTDMRRPRLHKSFGVLNDVGLSNAILGDIPLEIAIRPTEVDRLDILTCGPIPPNPAELLHTEAFRNVFASLKDRYDRIIFDSPPIGAVADGLVLASMVDGVVLVTESGQSSWQATLQSRRRIEDVGGCIYGVVLNNVDLDRRIESDYYYYRNYRYGYVADEKKA